MTPREISGTAGSLKKLMACTVLLLGLVLAVQTADVSAVKGDLVSRWSGEGSANDSVDGNHGTLQAGVSFVSGKVGQAFSFDGSAGAYIDLPNSPSLFPASGQITIAAWIKPDFSAFNLWDTILTKRDGCSSSGVAYQLAVNKGDGNDVYGAVVLALSRADGGIDRANAGAGAVTVPDDGQFHHVAGTFDGSMMKVYLDGQLVGQLARSEPLLGTTTTAPQIGHHGGCATQRADAVIDEIEFYNQALTGKRIGKLAKQ